jgi:hypothetical protein
MSGRADFLGADGKPRGALRIGPVTVTDRRNLTTLLPRAASGRVPRGTRRIRVTLTSIDDDKTLSSALADNAKLTFDARRAFRTDPLVELRAFINGNEPGVQVSVKNGNPFRVRGTLEARTVKRLGPRHKHLAMGPAAFQAPAGGEGAIRLALPPAARREFAKNHVLAVRLKAVVHDAAGHERTLRRTARVVPVA